MADEIIIYTDGGCDPNPGLGGWAAVIIEGKNRREISGAAAFSTNNRMELTAAIEALKAVKGSLPITLFTDSQYLKRGIDEWLPRWLAKNWRGANGPVANKDLWQELLRVTRDRKVNWRWIYGHTGNPDNERVDFLCRLARSQFRRSY